MTAYKKQTQPVWYKGRQVFDPSKRMFEEASDASRKDQDFLRDFQERSNEYSRALDNWNKNQGLLDKEKVEFFKTISKTIDTSVKNLVVDGMYLRDQAGIAKADKEWQAKSFTEKQRIQEEILGIIAKQSDNNLNRVNIAAELEKKGLTAYATFVHGQNSAFKTRIVLNILNENLNALPAKLRLALGERGDNATKYTIIHPTTGETIEFTAAEVHSDESLADLKIAAIADKVTEDSYWTANPNGLKNEIITGLIGDKVSDIKNRFIQEQALINKNNVLTENLNDLSGQLSTTLSLYQSWNGESFELTGPKAQLISKEIQNFLSSASVMHAGLGDAKSDEKARELLVNSLVAYVKAQGGNQEAAIKFVDNLLNGRGPHPVLLESRHEKYPDGRPKMVSLADIDQERFGVGGGWKQQLYTSDGSLISGGLTSHVDADQTELIAKLGFRPPSIIDEESGIDTAGKLWITVNGEKVLNPKWEGTIQYNWAKRKLEGKVVTDDEVFEVYKEFVRNGVTDQTTLNWFRNFDGSGYTKEKTASMLKTGVLDEFLLNEELVITEEIDAKYNRQAIKEWAKEKGYKIVEQHYGSEDPTVVAASNQEILAAVTGGNNLNGSTQALIDTIEKDVMSRVRIYQTNNPIDSVNYKTESQLIPFITEQVLSEFEIQKKDSTHKYYINENGIAINAQPKTKAIFNKTIDQNELNRLNDQATLTNFEKLIQTEGFDFENHKEAILSKDQLLRAVNGQIKWNARGTTKVGRTDRLPGYILRMAAQVDMNPYDFINMQARKTNIEDWVDLVPSKSTKALLDQFSAAELNTIYKKIPIGGLIHEPIKGISTNLNIKVNRMLKAEGLPALESENRIYNTLKAMSTAQVNTVGEGDNPGLGKYQILTSDVEAYYTRNNLEFDQNARKEFLNNPALQTKVMKDLISRVNSEAWGYAITHNKSKTSSGTKSRAEMLRQVYHRITTGGYITGYVDDSLGGGLNIYHDRTSLHSGNKFLQQFSQY